MVFLLQKTLVYTVPLLIVALAGMYAERSGIINIALDGIMVFGAFVGAFGATLLRKTPFFVDHSQVTFLLSMLIASAAGALFSLLLSFSAIKLKADQTIGGTALNMIAPALSLFIIKLTFHKDELEMARSMGSDGQYHDFGYVILNDKLGSVGSVFFDKMYISTYIAIAVFIILSILIYKTKYGLRLRACGEHPQAADSVGINVFKMRWAGVLISGLLGGLGGIVYITCGVSEWKFEYGVAGFGFLSLAVMIFGQWKPTKIALAALLFGFFRALSNVYFGFDFLKNLNIPSGIYNMLPYIISLVVLAFTSKKSRAPKAEGIPYDKGLR